MTTEQKTDLDALIERVRGATGPDRELDALVWCAVEHPMWKPVKSPIYKIREEWGFFDAGGFFRDAPRLSESLDAVSAFIDRLLPNCARKSGVCPCDLCDTDEQPGPWAQTFLAEGSDTKEGQDGFFFEAATEPLARLGSALTAIKAQEGRRG